MAASSLRDNVGPAMAWFRQQPRYHALDGSEAKAPAWHALNSSQRTLLWPCLVLASICLIQALGLAWMGVFGARDCGMPGKLQPVTFRDDARFHHLSTEAEVSRAWEAYNLPASGFVHVAASQLATLGLEPNKNVKEGMENVYMISAFHSLHCLQSIHKTFARLRANATAAANGTAPQDANHAAHCFDYLRQSLLCAGDMALEGPDSNPEAGESRLRGWGVEHQCRSWDSLVEWRDSHSVS